MSDGMRYLLWLSLWTAVQCAVSGCAGLMGSTSGEMSRLSESPGVASSSAGKDTGQSSAARDAASEGETAPPADAVPARSAHHHPGSTSSRPGDGNSPLEPAEPSPVALDPRQDVAVVGAIEDYVFMPDVPHAQRDATLFESFLVNARGIPTTRVHTLLNGQATRERLSRAVELALSQAGPASTFWFYFAGHGAASPTSGQRLLLGVDAQSDPEFLDDRAVDLDAIIDRIQVSRVARAVVVIDACHSGVTRAGRPLIPGVRVPQISRGREVDRVWVWSAASPSQAAYPYEAVRQGAFTYFAVNALKGAADRGLDGIADGRVSVAEAEAYVTQAFRRIGLTLQEPSRERREEVSRWVLNEGKLEAGPDLAALKPWIPPLPQTDTGILDELEGLEARRAERARQVEELTRREREVAASAWARVKALLETPGPEGPEALSRFIARYQDFSVDVGGVRVPISVPELSLALKTRDTVQKPGSSRSKSGRVLEKYGYQLVRLEAGEFAMGSHNGEDERGGDETLHRVQISRPFLMGATEVTQALWYGVMGNNPSRFQGDNAPVEQVSWRDAIAFCNRLSELEGLEPAYSGLSGTVTWNRDANGYRLPTEAEWEYAARAGSSKAFGMTDRRAEVCQYANVQSNRDGPEHSHFCVEDGHRWTAPVKSFAANAWNLYDMLGNVKEWVWDAYSRYPSTTVVDPAVDGDAGSTRVPRGGSFDDYRINEARLAARSSYNPSQQSNNLGFRIARSISR